MYTRVCTCNLYNGLFFSCLISYGKGGAVLPSFFFLQLYVLGRSPVVYYLPKELSLLLIITGKKNEVFSFLRQFKTQTCRVGNLTFKHIHIKYFRCHIQVMQSRADVKNPRQKDRTVANPDYDCIICSLFFKRNRCIACHAFCHIVSVSSFPAFHPLKSVLFPRVFLPYFLWPTVSTSPNSSLFSFESCEHYQSSPRSLPLASTISVFG